VLLRAVQIHVYFTLVLNDRAVQIAAPRQRHYFRTFWHFRIATVVGLLACVPNVILRSTYPVRDAGPLCAVLQTRRRVYVVK